MAKAWKLQLYQQLSRMERRKAKDKLENCKETLERMEAATFSGDPFIHRKLHSGMPSICMQELVRYQQVGYLHFWWHIDVFLSMPSDCNPLYQTADFLIKPLFKKTRKQVHKGYPLCKPQNSNNKPAPGMAIINSNCASPGFVFRCLEQAK